MISVRTVDAAVTTELRRSVLRPHWPVGSVLAGDADADAVHIAAFDDAALVCACLVLPHPHPELARGWQLRSMATATSQRGRGIGAQVVAAAIDVVRDHGADLIWCGARTTALAFWQRQGFVADSAEYVQQETGLPHVRMHRELLAAPTASG